MHYRQIVTELRRKPGMLGVVCPNAQNRIREIVEDLEAALAEFSAVSESLAEPPSS